MVLGIGDVLIDVKELEKLVIEYSGIYIVVVLFEVELGCFCGIVKGGCYSSNCLYLFIYFGSMV